MPLAVYPGTICDVAMLLQEGLLVGAPASGHVLPKAVLGGGPHPHDARDELGDFGVVHRVNAPVRLAPVVIGGQQGGAPALGIVVGLLPAPVALEEALGLLHHGGDGALVHQRLLRDEG